MNDFFSTSMLSSSLLNELFIYRIKEFLFAQFPSKVDDLCMYLRFKYSGSLQGDGQGGGGGGGSSLSRNFQT